MSEELRLAYRVRDMLIEDGYGDYNIAVETLDDLIRLLATPRGGE